MDASLKYSAERGKKDPRVEMWRNDSITIRAASHCAGSKRPGLSPIQPELTVNT